MPPSTVENGVGIGSSGETRQTKKPRPIDPIEAANKKTSEAFVEAYILPSHPNWAEWKHPRTGALYTLQLLSSGDVGEDRMASCFDLINETSGADYRGSSVGWHPALKKKEMLSPDLQYILVEDDQGTLKGFTSLMPTYECHEPVVYCYEIHLKPELQGTGLGRQLMEYLAAVARGIPTVDKVMLTCFTSNGGGMEFYRRLGFGVDDISPLERRLRGGKVVKPDYVILSKKITATEG